jgi:hypothetical protein
MAILRKALQRDPARRYSSAAEMGEACEHFLYDKGYGPTNLTLKQYLGALFREEGTAPAAAPAPSYFPVVEPTLIPIGDELPRRPGRAEDQTPVSHPPGPAPRPAKDAASTLAPDTLAPDPPRTGRRIKPRQKR